MSKPVSSLPIAFAGAPLDLREHERSAAQVQTYSKAPAARAIIVHEGEILADIRGKLPKVHPRELVGKHLYDPGPLFLGFDGKAPIFAFNMAQAQEGLLLGMQVKFENIRGLAATLGPQELALAGRAKSLFDWHKSHRFCAMCGVESRSQHGGIARQCPSCSTPHFPRVNPVVIMLVLNGDKCLLGRNAAWPDGAYSALAGFVSPGETLEEACKREVFEEVGIRCENPVYKLSQPWPFPSQLMIGLFCDTKQSKLTLDPKEISDARWFTREQVRGVFDGTDTSFACPPAFTIAHQLIKLWLDD